MTDPSTSPLWNIVCGFEKSGTTLLNEILRRHPMLDSGFECGFLLGESPRAFHKIHPYRHFFRTEWQLSEAELSHIIDTDDFDECYRRARDLSPVITDKSVYLFDKTPIYMLHLSQVLSRMPNLPCVVCVRDPRALMLSWSAWSGHSNDAQDWIEQNFESYVDRYLGYGRGYQSALKDYSENIYLNQHEMLCSKPEQQARSIFEFLKLDFSEDYLSFDSKYFVYGSNVSKRYIAPYQGKLSASLCEKILAATAEFSCWHFHV